MTDIIKVRERHGTSSLDLTLPAKIRKENKIKKGDVFKVEYKKENNKLQIIYTLVYKD
jgi:bifunctional DNA-binding transcriptional regulator/antitoxin component of YhaV-PrlF toxin-antitoxin module